MNGIKDGVFGWEVIAMPIYNYEFGGLTKEEASKLVADGSHFYMFCPDGIVRIRAVDEWFEEGESLHKEVEG